MPDHPSFQYLNTFQLDDTQSQEKKRQIHKELTPVYKTEVKKASTQPVVGIVPATGCLVSFVFGYSYNTLYSL